MLPVQLETVSMQTRDRIRLDADVYRPAVAGEFPVLLMRQPYGRAIASTVVYAHPTWYAAQGYIVVIQDVRGRGSSAGQFCLFETEVADGYDTVEWAAQLLGSTGQVGMYGFSYQGMTQLYAASARPAALKAIAPAMVGYDLYGDWAYENGALCLQAGLGWALQIAAETARLQAKESAFQALYAAARNLPLTGAIPARPQILSELAPDSFFHDWLDHPQPDSYWSDLKPQLAGVKLPMLHIGGWFDPYLRGDVRLFKEMQGSAPQHFWVGPWGHIPWGQIAGERDFGPAAASPVDRLQIRWFDHFLKGQDSGLLVEAPVCLFEMGSNQWRQFEEWPTGQTKSYFLSSSGLASLRQDDGRLVESIPETQSVPDVIVHDPWRPVPSLGGHAGIPAGSFERSHLDNRSDVLTYTTAALASELRVAGELTVEVYCGADVPSFDLSAVLSEVGASGQVYNLTQGYGRFESSDNNIMVLQKYVLALQPTCFWIPAGHALRLSLSGAAFPAYGINSGTGVAAGKSRLIESRIITLAIASDKNHPSNVQLAIAVAPA
ncbi:MAG: CocE/NonD family hydrolase [Leptolyngbyaceae cyanobacterium SL_1_1]|nr:CocE/NonD family hydrolase [Leptolyngbyaceae cyanobacterium RM1_1_2]NJO11400.1 CocE/NonD family hydrolase [Leptolyngbyaceae cyanobacterium SL_1_1]